MNFFPKNADGTILGEQEPNRILSPIPESEYLKKCEAAAFQASKNAPAASSSCKSPSNVYEIARSPEGCRDMHKLDHVVTGPDVSVMPGDEPPPPRSSKRTSARKSIIVCGLLSLGIGIAIGIASSNSNAVTKNSLRGVQAMISSVPSKSEQLPPPAPAVATATDPAIAEITNRMDAIARDLSVVQQNLKELAAGQDRIRKAQEQLAETQSHFTAMQAQATTKQNKRPAPDPTEGRKLNRHDPSFYRWR